MIPYSSLDPRVRELVRALAGHGFTPTDSGDGVSKCKAGMVFPFLHVVMTTAPDALIAEANRLHLLIPTLGHKRLVIEANYRPSDGVGVLFLFQEAKS